MLLDIGRRFYGSPRGYQDADPAELTTHCALWMLEKDLKYG